MFWLRNKKMIINYPLLSGGLRAENNQKYDYIPFLMSKHVGLLVTGLDIKKIESKIFLPVSFNICFGAQKNRLNETVL